MNAPAPVQQQATQQVPTKNNRFALEIIKEVEPEIIDLLPASVSAEHFIRVASHALMSVNPNEVTPASLKKALVRCATDGLVPDGKEAAIVVYKNKETKVKTAQYQPMIDGVLKLLYQSGSVKKIFAKVVYQDDVFEYGVNINGEYLNHIPNFDTPRHENNIKLVYAVAKLANDETVIEVMTKDEIDKIRAIAKTDIVWNSHYDRMALKTVLHRICRRIPGTINVARVLERDIDINTSSSASILETIRNAGSISELRELTARLKHLPDEQKTIAREAWKQRKAELQAQEVQA